MFNSDNVAVYVFGSLAAMGGFCVGYDIGIISSVMTMTSYVNEFLTPNNDYRSALLVALMLLTATLSGLHSGPLCDRISRKYTIVVGSITFSLGCLLETIGTNFVMMLMGRLFVGLGQGYMTNAIPLYHSEIAPPKIRGRLITLFSVASSIGTVVGYFVTFGTMNMTSDWSWRLPFLIHLVVCLMVMLAYFLPFSPRWLIDVGRHDEARAVLSDLMRCPPEDPKIQAEFDALVTEIEMERTYGVRSYLECFKGTNLRRTMYALFVGNGAAFTGTSAISYYSPQIMAQAGLSDVGVSLVASGASNIVALIFTLFTLAFIDHIGRKFNLASGAFVMGATMYVCGALFQTYYTVIDDQGDYGLDNTNARNTVIAFVFLFQAAYAWSWGPTGYIYPSEILNQRTRSRGIGLAYGLNWAISIFMTFVMPIFMNNTVFGGYYLFAGTCTVLFIGTFFLPETQKLSLHEVDLLFQDPSPTFGKQDVDETALPQDKVQL
ncbi:general substrate transporter [Hesseltinella vesiculosa]|uniref:General substrate transporter n=1 Tax=Hesseltinella vesiculosa TaxID=101127 RepID=A0A1X2GS42_9FUNG|nr:general substrate transporter [Hesseltinella vesiculosa]